MSTISPDTQTTTNQLSPETNPETEQPKRQAPAREVGVAIPIVSIPFTEIRSDGEDFVVYYMISIQLRGSKWTVYRRYNDFREFMNTISEKYPVISALFFPHKKLLYNFEEEFIEERRAQLEVWLLHIVARIDPFEGLDVYRFFGFDLTFDLTGNPKEEASKIVGCNFQFRLLNVDGKYPFLEISACLNLYTASAKRSVKPELGCELTRSQQSWVTTSIVLGSDLFGGRHSPVFFKCYERDPSRPDDFSSYTFIGGFSTTFESLALAKPTTPFFMLDPKKRGWFVKLSLDIFEFFHRYRSSFLFSCFSSQAKEVFGFSSVVRFVLFSSHG